MWKSKLWRDYRKKEINNWGGDQSFKKKKNLKFYREEIRNPGSRNGNYIEYMYFAPRF